MPPKTNQRIHGAALVFALLSLPLFAQEGGKREALFRRPSITALRVKEAPVLDGRMDDAAWERAQASGPLLQEQPDEGAASTERTEFRVVYTSTALYIGLWCFDREPEKIISRLMARDSPLPKDDAVCIALDPFLDRRTSVQYIEKSLP